VIDEALARHPEPLTVSTHLCRGNYCSSWAADGSYDFVAEALFGELSADANFLEFDDERSGDSAPLRYLAPGKLVVLGLVTTNRALLESPNELKRRIEQAARVVPLEQLCLLPQFGFSATVDGCPASFVGTQVEARSIAELIHENFSNLCSAL